jgi:hypothetical protein
MSVEPKTFDSRSWEKKLFKITLLGLAVLFVGAFVPILGLIVFIPFFCTALLWCYSGAAFVCLAFPVVFLIHMRSAHRLRTSVASAARWSVILFGVLGVVLMLSVFVVPGYKSFTLGYWIHAKIWLSTAQVRDWAAHQKGITDSAAGVPYSLWPSSLKLASLGSGRVQVDPETRSVLLVDGGGFGHWGIRVTGPDATDSSFGSNYALKVQPGAWVWHEIQ